MCAPLAAGHVSKTGSLSNSGRPLPRSLSRDGCCRRARNAVSWGGSHGELAQGQLPGVVDSRPRPRADLDCPRWTLPGRRWSLPRWSLPRALVCLTALAGNGTERHRYPSHWPLQTSRFRLRRHAWVCTLQSPAVMRPVRASCRRCAGCRRQTATDSGANGRRLMPHPAHSRSLHALAFDI